MFSALRFATLAVAIGVIALAGCNRSSTSETAAAVGGPLQAAQPLLTQPVSKYSLIVPVVIGGQQYHFLFDTGSSYTIVDRQLAPKLTRQEADKDIPAIVHKGFAGAGVSTPGAALDKASVTFWHPQPLVIGSRTVTTVLPWIGADLSHMTQAMGQRIDGLIGDDVMRQLAWKVDNKTRTLAVWNSTPAIAGYEHCMPFQSSFPQPPQVELTTRHGQWGAFTIDTGATDMFVSTQTLKGLHQGGMEIEQVGTSGFATVNGVDSTASYLLGGFEFGGAPVGRVAAIESAGGLDNLGMGFLSRLDSYLIAPAEMLFCYNAGNLARNDVAAWRFINLAYRDGRVEIGENDAAQLAALGLQSGDVLLEVDKRPVQPTDIGELREKMDSAPKGKLEIVIERQGVRKTLTL